MKRYILTFIAVLSAIQVGEAQEICYTRAQVDSIIASARPTYEAPAIDSVILDGTVEEVAAELKEKGWRNPFSRFPEEELEKAGFHKRTRYLKGVWLEGIFMGRKANLILYPISVENRDIAYASISVTMHGNNLAKFIEKEVMPVVHKYAEKYGEYRITDIDSRYENSDRSTTRQDYGNDRHIITFAFEDPEILLRAQTDCNGRFSIVIQYINTLNLATQLLDSPDNYHCPPPPTPPPPHNHRHRSH